MISFDTPLSGMLRAAERVNVAAGRIARAPAPAETGDQVDLSTGMVALLEARNAFAANVKMAKTEAGMAKGLFDLMA